MKRWFVLAALGAVCAAGVALYATGNLAALEVYAKAAMEPASKPVGKTEPAALEPPVVSVVIAEPAPFVATVLVTGSVVPREEILVAPEVSGQRILEVLVDEGDRVRKGQVLARLVTSNLDAQIAQNQASQARAKAAISQARSTIEQAKAAVAQADAALKRAEPLKRGGHISDSAYDDRLAAARTARAQLNAAQDGLRVAEAEQAQAEAQYRELAWRRDNTEVRAPANGLVSRRTAKIGALATSTADPMFRIIEDGDVELLGELTAEQLAAITIGQAATIDVSGAGSITGKVRLVSPEVDPVTRLGHVRIALPPSPNVRIGAFARGRIETGRSVGLSVPLSAVMYDGDTRYVLAVEGDAVQRIDVATGLKSGDRIEVTKGLSPGSKVVAKAGTFLRDGDRVRAEVQRATRISGVQ